MVKKNFDDDTAATDARKNRIRVGYINTLNGSNSFAQTSDPLGKANESFTTGKAEASDLAAELANAEGVAVLVEKTEKGRLWSIVQL